MTERLILTILHVYTLLMNLMGTHQVAFSESDGDSFTFTLAFALSVYRFSYFCVETVPLSDPVKLIVKVLFVERFVSL